MVSRIAGGCRRQGLIEQRVTERESCSLNRREEHASESAWRWVIIAALIGVTTFIYWPVRNFEFVTLDDIEYVTHKPWVQTGFSWDGFQRAWTEPVAANWHPLTMLTHMADCQLFGVNAGWHHLTNVALHVTCSVLVFWVLLTMTGRMWPAAAVAALFAWHPLHVESVAWISERKDVLSGTLGLCVLAAYVAYVRDVRLWRYAVVFVLLLLGLLAKPMLVTLPAVLLLLDFWPLQRLRGWDSSWRDTFTRYRWLLLEKLPLLGLAVASSAITFLVQRNQGAVEAVERFPLSGRLANAVVAYIAYLGKMVWPQDLAVPYPLAGTNSSGLQVVGAALLLVVISIVAWRLRRRMPWLVVGWLWYLGMLVPVIGIVQVGRQSMADRYTYLPSLGISIAVVWSIAYWARRQPLRGGVASVLSACVLLAFAVASSHQVGYWRNSSVLYQHALNVTRNNATAHLGLANELVKQHELVAAIEHYRRGVVLEPENGSGHYNLAVVLLGQRVDLDEAEASLRAAQSLEYNPAAVHARLGEVYLLQDLLEQSLTSYRAALGAGGPQSAETIVGMSVALVRSGDTPSAVNLLVQTMQNGFHPPIADKLAWIYATHPDERIRKETVALELASEVCRQTQNTNPDYLDTLAAAFAANGQFETALSAGSSALRLARELDESPTSQRWHELARELVRRLATYGREQPFRDDPKRLKF